MPLAAARAATAPPHVRHAAAIDALSQRLATARAATQDAVAPNHVRHAADSSRFIMLASARCIRS